MSVQDVQDFNMRRRGAMYRIKLITDIAGNSKTSYEPYASMIHTVVANVQMILDESANTDRVFVEMERIFDRNNVYRHSDMQTGYLAHITESSRTIKLISARTIFELVAVAVECRDLQ